MHRAWLSAVVVIVVAASGCGKREEKVTVVTPAGTITSTESGDTTTVKGPDGAEVKVTEGSGKSTSESKDAEGNITKTESGKGADMSGMAVPQYPGSSLKDDNSQGKIEAGGVTSHVMNLISPDAPATVLAWYKGQLSDAVDMSSGEGGMVMGKAKSGAQVTVVATKKDTGTEIVITSAK